MNISKQLRQSFLPLLEAEILLAFVLQQPRTYLHIHGNIAITNEQQQLFFNAVERRLDGEPIAYIVGEKEFWSLRLRVNADVLIPRPTTELLVELILQRFPDQADFHVADLGTGSGAIALALSKERPQWQVTAVDLSTAALTLAQYNAKQLAINKITFLQSDWGNKLLAKKFHLIVSNPPYISSDDHHLHQGDLRFEPQLALVANKEGLVAFEIISAQAKEKLVTNGYLFFEHGYSQAPAVQHILRTHSFTAIKTFQDLDGHNRVSCGHII